MNPTARMLSPDAPLPYLATPIVDECSRVVFWTHHWMHDTAEFEELKAYRCTKTGQAQFERNIRLWSAMASSQYELRRRAEESLENLKKTGGLLFAWSGTTVVRGGGVVA